MKKETLETFTLFVANNPLLFKQGMSLINNKKATLKEWVLFVYTAIDLYYMLYSENTVMDFNKVGAANWFKDFFLKEKRIA